MQKVTLGGDRLGSGNKNKIALRNYERSTHNLSAKFTSSMQCGVLYPFSVIPAMRGDSFTIDVDADARTIPTKGPLFGSFKMQIDYFQCPFRLYQALLHNNPLALGLKMNQVKLPIITPCDFNKKYDKSAGKMNNTSLLKYLGLSGIGQSSTYNGLIQRNINAIPVLAYYEIFKTYYANKQEEKAYVISANETLVNGSVDTLTVNGTEYDLGENAEIIEGYNTIDLAYLGNDEIFFNNKTAEQVRIKLNSNTGGSFSPNIKYLKEIANKYSLNTFFKYSYENNTISIVAHSVFLNIVARLNAIGESIVSVTNTTDTIQFSIKNELELIPFSLANIDDMRLAILSKHELGTPFKIGNNAGTDWNLTSGTDQTGLPYSVLVDYDRDGTGKGKNKYPLNGLVVKTYQSDLFNNWVKTEWIDGENGISAITAISTASGSFTIDTLNLSEKLYNMLNRVAVSDGSYEGWQDAVYTETPKRHIESPVYLGGASNEIMFEEIVQTSETGNTALGTLAGKGKLIKRKGGHIHVKVDEASFIIGIVSLTPRNNYTQGNEWYLTELNSMDDLHKPALDGIGFENLIGERLAWWDTEVNVYGNPVTRSTIGKVPAWINYMTRVDKGYGDFAETEGNGFMLLQRNYEQEMANNGSFSIGDATTYIDPQKFNYAFAYTGLDAQNFWVQIYEHVTARRLMSAKQIPNI